MTTISVLLSTLQLTALLLKSFRLRLHYYTLLNQWDWELPRTKREVFSGTEQIFFLFWILRQIFEYSAISWHLGARYLNFGARYLSLAQHLKMIFSRWREGGVRGLLQDFGIGVRKKLRPPLVGTWERKGLFFPTKSNEACLFIYLFCCYTSTQLTLPAITSGMHTGGVQY